MKVQDVFHMVQDMERGARFYRDMLGLDVKDQTPEWSSLTLGDAIIVLRGGGTGELAWMSRVQEGGRRGALAGQMRVSACRRAGVASSVGPTALMAGQLWRSWRTRRGTGLPSTASRSRALLRRNLDAQFPLSGGVHVPIAPFRSYCWNIDPQNRHVPFSPFRI